MSEPIKVGDLVQIVRPTSCCGSTIRLGRIFVAGRIVVRCKGSSCMACGASREGITSAMNNGDCCWDGLYRLKRIPPLGELDDVKREEEITA